uniref:Secreted protein n=1 Tax=Catagonus wagneri TaxID=51154 RepID=A0A8C3YFM5_9CETA
MYLKPSLFLVLYFLSGNCKEVVLRNKLNKNRQPSALPVFLFLWSLSMRKSVFELPAAVTGRSQPLLRAFLEPQPSCVLPSRPLM